MKHILKTTAIGGMSMLYCFALEAMDQNSISLDGTSQDGKVFTMTIRPSEFTTTIRPTDNIGNFFFELLRSSNVDLQLPSSNEIVHLSASPIEKATVKADNENVAIEKPVFDLFDAVSVYENKGDFSVIITGGSLRSVEALNKELSKELEGIDLSKVTEICMSVVDNFHSFEGLMDFPELKNLTINMGAIDSVSWLRAFPKLEHLWLAGSRIASLEGFPELLHLEVLNIDMIPAKSLKGLPDLPVLKKLTAGGFNSPIESIEDLPQLPKLEELCVRDCKLKSLKGIENCPNLKSLDIANTNVSEAEALEYSKKHPNCEIRFGDSYRPRTIKNGEYIR